MSVELANKEAGRCEAMRNPGVWPYMSRCVLAPHDDDDEHVDAHGRWRDEPIGDVELPTTFAESNALLLVQGGHQAQAGRILDEMTSVELRDLTQACDVLTQLCDSRLTSRTR